MFLYHAIHDQAPAIADVHTLVEKYRSKGVEITYRRYRGGDHLIVILRAVPSALHFPEQRFSKASTERDALVAYGTRSAKMGSEFDSTPGTQ